MTTSECIESKALGSKIGHEISGYREVSGEKMRICYDAAVKYLCLFILNCLIFESSVEAGNSQLRSRSIRPGDSSFALCQSGFYNALLVNQKALR